MVVKAAKQSSSESLLYGDKRMLEFLVLVATVLQIIVAIKQLDE